MTRRTLPLVLAGALLATLSACSDSTAPMRSDPDLRGRVVDADGQPVWGATIVLQYALVAAPASEGGKFGVGWAFDLGQAGPVHAWIYSSCGGDTIRTLANRVMPAGAHTLVWDGHDDMGRLVPAGVYRIRIDTENSLTISSFVLSRSGYDSALTPFDVAASATTNTAGDFRLDAQCQPFDDEFPAYDDQGDPLGIQLVTRRVRVWAMCEGYAPVASDWTEVDAQRGANVTIRLPQPPTAR